MSKILIIDDEAANVRVLSISLKADGYQVVTAYSGEEGLEVYRKESPDVVLTDIKMPGMDGIEVLQHIKRQAPESEVIIITGHGDIENAIEALKYGASDFINKPIRDEVLAIALQRALEKLDIKRRLKAYTDNLEQEVRMATRELRRQSNFLKKLIGSSNDGIVATDRDFKIVVFNPAAEKIFGYRQDEVMENKTALDLFPEEIARPFQEKAGSPAGAGEILALETTITASDQTPIPVGFAGTLLYENGRMMGSVAFFQDLREVKRLEQELVRSERLAAVGQTVAGLAHGIKNILHGLKGGSYLVDVGIEKNNTERLKTGWEMIQRNIGRTSELVMDLLSYSKERQPEYEPCDPNQIVGDVAELVRERARENDIEVATTFDPAIGTAVMDPRTIHESLLNLASNAVDACIFDDNIAKNWQISLATAKEADFVRFEVRDNGVGMSSEVRAKLFTSFFSTKGHRGTGLGLLVTRKRIEEHGGTISVDSQLGIGTTFVVRLPCGPLEDRGGNPS